MNDLPAIAVKLSGADGRFNGTITFFFQKRSDPSASWRVEGETTVPLLSPHRNGKVLTFEVEHHRCHDCAELDPNVRFRMELVGPNEARLWNLNEESNETLQQSPGLLLLRQAKDASGPSAVMQKGTSVQLPVTTAARPIPDADRPDSAIVSVTAGGSIFLGVEPVDPAELAEKIEHQLAGQAEKKIYIKADARSPYAAVVKVVDSARVARVSTLIFLTAQPGLSVPIAKVAPQGFAATMSR